MRTATASVTTETARTNYARTIYEMPEGNGKTLSLDSKVTAVEDPVLVYQ